MTENGIAPMLLGFLVAVLLGIILLMFAEPQPLVVRSSVDGGVSQVWPRP